MSVFSLPEEKLMTTPMYFMFPEVPCFVDIFECYNLIFKNILFINLLFHCFRLLAWPPWSPQWGRTLTTWTSTYVTPPPGPSQWWPLPWESPPSCLSSRLFVRARSPGRLDIRASKLYNRLPFSWAVPSCLISRIWSRLLNMVSFFEEGGGNLWQKFEPYFFRSKLFLVKWFLTEVRDG